MSNKKHPPRGAINTTNMAESADDDRGTIPAAEAPAKPARNKKVASEAALVRGMLSGIPARSVVTFLAQTMSLADATKMAQAIMSGEDATAKHVTHIADVEGLTAE